MLSDLFWDFSDFFGGGTDALARRCSPLLGFGTFGIFLEEAQTRLRVVAPLLTFTNSLQVHVHAKSICVNFALFIVLIS